MPYYHCTECHHEFEFYPEKHAEVTDPKCDWCGQPSYLLEEKTPLEQMTDEIEKMGTEKFLERLGMIEETLDTD